MFYMNKSDYNDVVELIYSEAGVVIVIDQADTIKSGRPVGKIIKKGKKQFKKDFKKASDQYIKIEETPEYTKEYIIEYFLTEKYGIINHTETYVDRKKFLDRQEDFKRQTEKEYKKILQDLADPYPSEVSDISTKAEKIEKLLHNLKA